MKILTGVLCATVSVLSASACDLCSLYVVTEAKEARPGWEVGVAEQYSHFRDWREDGIKIPNEDHEFIDSSITQFLLGYRFNHQFGLQVNVPVIYRSFRRVIEHDIVRGRESGIGDVSIIGRYRVSEKLWEDGMATLDLFGGLKLPTGDASRLSEEAHEDDGGGGHHHPSGVHGHDLALGSGSVDGIIGASGTVQWRRVFLAAEIQYALRTEGRFDYQFANDLTWNGGPGVYLWLDHRGSAALQFVVSGEWKGNDKMAGVRTDDTGITAVYLGPAVSATWGERLSAECAVDLPVHQHTSGLQIVPDYRVRGGVTIRL